jgi:hypothetical protein
VDCVARCVSRSKWLEGVSEGVSEFMRNGTWALGRLLVSARVSRRLETGSSPGERKGFKIVQEQ